MRFAVHYREDTPARQALVALGLLVWALGFATLFQQAGAAGIGTAWAWAMAALGLITLGESVFVLRSSGPPVRLGMEGLRDRRWSDKPINWRNIAEFDPVRRLGVEAVLLRLDNPDADPPTRWRARAARALLLVPGDAVLVPVAGLDCTAPELAARILEIGTAAMDAADEAEAWAAGSAYAAPPLG